MTHDDQCCSWDDFGNPGVCSGLAKEEPDCGTCCDSGAVLVFENDGPRTENCPDCNPTPEQHAAQLAEAQRARDEFDRLLAAYDGEPPF